MKNPDATDKSMNYKRICNDLIERIDREFRSKPIDTTTVWKIKIACEHFLVDLFRCGFITERLSSKVLESVIPGQPFVKRIEVLMQLSGDWLPDKGFRISIDLNQMTGDINIHAQDLVNYDAFYKLQTARA